MTKETLARKIFEMAYDANTNATNQRTMQITADTLGVIHNVLDKSPAGWDILDKALRKAFPEQYDVQGLAKIKHLRHYKRYFVQGAWVLHQMSPEEIKALTARNYMPWEKAPTEAEDESQVVDNS